MTKKSLHMKTNRGMTYVELIVVLSIFSMMTSITLFNYRQFQAKVDVKNLASDIALKIVEAQKSSLSGRLPTSVQPVNPATWKPSYGLYFDKNIPIKFIYFADLDNSGGCSDSSCYYPYNVSGGEVREVVNISNGNSISNISLTGPVGCSSATGFSVVFKRPDSSANIGGNVSGCTSSVSYAEITILSQKGGMSKIKIYASGRIQVD